MKWPARLFRKKSKAPTTLVEKIRASKGRALRIRISDGIEQDEAILGIPCAFADTDDSTMIWKTINDLLFVANEFKDYCAGLSANQIGYSTKIFVVKIDDEFVPFVNAKILATSGGRKTHKEHCLSRMGKPPAVVKRWKEIQIESWDMDRQTVTKEWITDHRVAQIIQHETDHGRGRLV